MATRKAGGKKGSRKKSAKVKDLPASSRQAKNVKGGMSKVFPYKVTASGSW